VIETSDDWSRFPLLKLGHFGSERESHFDASSWSQVPRSTGRILAGISLGPMRAERSIGLRAMTLGGPAAKDPIDSGVRQANRHGMCREADSRMIEAASASLLYLPPYSPDFNPIENAFTKLKALLRKAAERTVDHLWTAIGRLIDLFTPVVGIGQAAKGRPC
jgi:hypothetical protein